LKQLYADFGTEVTMTLNPFVYGDASSPNCFDEASPCILEQTSMCVIHVATQAANGDAMAAQAKFVPWLVCMDSNGDPVDQCNQQVGVDSAAVQSCLKTDAADLLKQYLQTDAPIRATPTTLVNGKQVKADYADIKQAICSADSTVSACSSVVV